MSEIPRLNGVIAALEAGKPAFTTFTPPDVESAIALSQADYDGIVFEMEHNPYDVRALRDCLQYMLNRRQIVSGGSLAPRVTPIVRIPPNGVEQNSWVAKQVLDLGVYGVVWPHVGTVEEARSAVSACRYPRPPESSLYDPPGLRGDAPNAAARYWGLTQQEYYSRADVWPLAPLGEILAIIMIEEVRAIDNLPRILKEVPGIGVILIGEGDLSQELGHPRQYEHPAVQEAIGRIVQVCKDHNVPVGHPHVDEKNVERILEQGFRFLMPAPVRSYGGLAKGRQLAGRG
ncbi:MAG TPA: aldolase/citrate lyase family protein [Dehalococcoidia bacterium]|nr:aldolase/citrate lyase family protein [Dehalococcoidia bacterium]